MLTFNHIIQLAWLHVCNQSQSFKKKHVCKNLALCAFICHPEFRNSGFIFKRNACLLAWWLQSVGKWGFLPRIWVLPGPAVLFPPNMACIGHFGAKSCIPLGFLANLGSNMALGVQTWLFWSKSGDSRGIRPESGTSCLI